jgi:hypothetical protein
LLLVLLEGSSGGGARPLNGEVYPAELEPARCNTHAEPELLGVQFCDGDPPADCPPPAPVPVPVLVLVPPKAASTRPAAADNSCCARAPAAGPSTEATNCDTTLTSSDNN